MPECAAVQVTVSLADCPIAHLILEVEAEAAVIVGAAVVEINMLRWILLVTFIHFIASFAVLRMVGMDIYMAIFICSVNAIYIIVCSKP